MIELAKFIGPSATVFLLTIFIIASCSVGQYVFEDIPLDSKIEEEQ